MAFPETKNDSTYVATVPKHVRKSFKMIERQGDKTIKKYHRAQEIFKNTLPGKLMQSYINILEQSPDELRKAKEKIEKQFNESINEMK